MPLAGPSLAGRSNRIVSTSALTRWAAICAPITPAPRTATLRMRSCGMGCSGLRKVVDRLRTRAETRGKSGSAGAQAGGRETDQGARGLLAVRLLGHPGRALDQAEVGHRIGQGAGGEVEAPVQVLLRQFRQRGADRLGEFAQYVAVVVGQELAQAVVL